MPHPQNPRPYNIHPAWPEERLAALLRRGLGCADRAVALQALRHLDGQLFAEYCALLAPPGASGREFLSGVSFEAALQVYRFDAALRVLLFDAIQTIEMSLRAQWANAPAAAHGPLFYMNATLFRRDFRSRSGGGWGNWSYREALAELLRNHQRRQEFLDWPSIQEMPPPPAREMARVMSLGQLARWCRYLRGRKEREGIAHVYGMRETVLHGFLPGLVAVRNICAHHDRLYGGGAGFLYTRTSEEPAALRDSFAGAGDGSLYPVVAFMAFLLLQIDRAAHRKFACGLLGLFAEYETANPRRLGFPDDWRRKPVWKP